MAALIICANCGQEKEHEAFGLCRLCYMHRYNGRRREKRLAYDGAYREAHREYYRGYMRHYRQENPEKLREYRKRYREQHPQANAIKKSRRRAREALLPCTLTAVQAEQKLAIGHCFYCGGKVDLTLDHFVAISRGGGTTKANMVVACLNCNKRKFTKPPTSYLEQLAFA